ncbi:MAG: nitric oxide reductase transcriptional regulator NorR [Desulfobacterales bacterium]|jgi:anaerobic nitric oxide reductase transcription regulator
MDMLDTIVSIGLDLTAALNATDRYQRLLESLNRIIPYDAAALLRIDEDVLTPVAARGLSPDAMGRPYARKEHPRLDIICNSKEPVRFPADTSLPDPFDGMLEKNADALSHIHACLGCPLYVENKLVGALTADALNQHAFDHLEQRFLTAIGALAGAQMQTVNLIEALEYSAKRQGQIASDLMRDIQMRQGTQIIGSSHVIAHLRQEIDLVARSNFTVLVLGETGVGKELVVSAIHSGSERREMPMLYLNCAALPETLADSELFGHTKGAFTGANRDRAGKFELADGGTLFLDEIGELPLSIQAKLLRAIQQGEVQRVGSEKTNYVDVRLLVATNRNLEQEVKAARFRADLYHRLNVYPINVPPLRERKEDIPLLAGYFCELIQRRIGTAPVRISTDTLNLLSRYHWPGNVRELENILSRAVLKASIQYPRGEAVIIEPVHLGGDISTEDHQVQQLISESAPALLDGRSFREAVDEFQKELITRAVAHRKGNWSAAARDLNMHRSNLHNLAKRLGLRKKRTLPG